MLVRDRMTPKPVTVTTETNVRDALALVRSKHFRHLPVVDQDGKLAGIVTEKDLVLAAPTPTTTLSIFEVNYILSRTSVGRIMKTSVVTVDPNLPIEEAARVMVDHKIGCLPVLENGDLIGIISDTDIFRVFVEGMGGGYHSLRVTVVVPEQVGSLARVTGLLSQMGANIHSLGTFWGEDKQSRLVAFRLEGIDRESILKGLEAEGIQVAGVWEAPAPAA